MICQLPLKRLNEGRILKNHEEEKLVPDDTVSAKSNSNLQERVKGSAIT